MSLELWIFLIVLFHSSENVFVCMISVREEKKWKKKRLTKSFFKASHNHGCRFIFTEKSLTIITTLKEKKTFALGVCRYVMPQKVSFTGYATITTQDCVDDDDEATQLILSLMQKTPEFW